MPTTTQGSQEGRLCNQIIRNLFISRLARNNNLLVIYNNTHKYYKNQQRLGLKLFSGKYDYRTRIILNDTNVLKYIDRNDIQSNFNFNTNVFFQTPECSNFLYTHIRRDLQNSIIEANPFKSRYNNNNEVFIHIRLGDVADVNPGFTYYDKVLSLIQCQKGYIGTDSPEHPIIQQLQGKYNLEVLKGDEVYTLQFGSTCKYVILSHGSFSAVTGYLSFFSTVYYPEYDVNTIWHGDIFCIPEWNKIAI